MKTKIEKALIVDTDEAGIPKDILARMKKLFRKIVFIASVNARFKQDLADTDAILCNISTQINEEVINLAPRIKYIGVLATAYDGIDTVYARKKKITVTNLGGYSTEAVAEWTIAVLFETARELERAKQQARTGDYSFASFIGTELAGKTLGVIGAGKIGSRVAELGFGIGMKVQYFSPHRKPELEKRGIKKVDLNWLLKTSDVISLNVIQNKETDGMINKTKIKLMKKDAIFVTTAGVGPIDWGALAHAVKNGKIAFIFHSAHGLNPAIIKELVPLKNVEFYPGMAFRTVESNAARWETFISNIEQFAKGKPQNVVN